MLPTPTAAINNIPNEILVLILRRLTSTSTRMVRKWHYGLKLLSVCRKWRLLAIPLVYRQLNINVLSCVDTEGDIASALVYKSMVTTNLDLITALGYGSHLRDLAVWVECLKPPYTHIDNVLQVLRGNALALQRIKKLEIELVDGLFETDSSSYNAELDRRVACSMADEFVALVPNVMSFACSPEIALTSRQNLYFLCELTNRYRPQVCSLNASLARLQYVDRFSDILTNLRLTASEDGAIPELCVNPAFLKRLVLGDTFNNTIWNMFADGPNNACINFSNLISLSISSVALLQHIYRIHRTVNWQGNNNACRYRILAPRLKYLNFFIHPPIYSVLLSISLPDYLDTLNVIIGKNMIITMRNVESRKALKVITEQTSLRIETFGQEVLLANKILNVPNMAHHLLLTLYVTADTFPVHAVSWTNLSSLRIVWRIKFVTVLAILEKAPNLKDLNADSVDCVDQQGNFVLPSLHMIQKDKFEPINTKIQQINLYCIIFDKSQDSKVDAICEYLQARIATLKQICITTPTTRLLRLF